MRYEWGLKERFFMASRILHLAVAEELSRQISVSDKNRFRLGCILPDAHSPATRNSDSHLAVYVCGKRKKTYDLDRFLSMFEKEMKEDDLYRGYYLHLIQDLAFRDLIYNKHKWNPTVSGNIERLYNDYHVINAYIIKKYGLKNDIQLTDNLFRERLYSLCPFEAEEFLMDLEKDFQDTGEGEIFFFTKAIADEFITIATEHCMKELQALEEGRHYVDAYEQAWLVNAKKG